jgi:hypothetical protein
MEHAQDPHLGVAHPVEESKRIHEKLAHAGLIELRSYRPAFSQGFQRLCRAENALKDTPGIIHRFLRDERNA